MRLQNVRQDMEEGGTWEGKRSWGWKKGNKKRKRNGKIINLLGQLVTEIFTKYCIVAYESNI